MKKLVALPLLLTVAVICLTVATLVGAKAVPEMITIDNLRGPYSPVEFNHKGHIDIAGSCGKCHHTHTQKTYAECNRCHKRVSELFKAEVNHSFLPCRDCHGEHNLKDLTVPSLKVAYHQVCFRCHVGIGELGSSPASCTKVCHRPLNQGKGGR